MSRIYATPSLTFAESFDKATKNIFKCEGRSRRSEFWWTMGAVYLTNMFLTPFVGSILGLLTIPLKIRRLHDTGRSGWWWGISAIMQVVIISCCVFEFLKLFFFDGSGSPSDRNVLYFILKYALLWGAVLFYKIILLVFYCLDSDPGTNKYGESPKYVVEGEK